MKVSFWRIGLLAALLLALFAPVALAQDGSGDRLVIGQSFVLEAGEELNGNLVVVGGSATVQTGSAVRGDVAVLGGNLVVAGTVQGDVVLFGGAVALQETANVGGNVAVLGGALRRDPGAVVAGDVFSGAPTPFPPRLTMPTLRTPGPDGALGALGSLILWQLVTLGWVAGLALLGAIAVSLAPRAMERIATQAARDTFVSFSMGLLTLVVGFLLGLLLLIACCSGLVVWLALGAAWLVGWLAVGLWLGQRVLQALHARHTTAIGEVALGVAAITILSRLPWCIGFLGGLIFGCIGLGAVVLTRFGTRAADDGTVAPPAGDEAARLTDASLVGEPEAGTNPPPTGAEAEPGSDAPLQAPAPEDDQVVG